MHSSATVDVESLLRYQPWLRRLTLDLVGPQHAEDLEQQTWLAALERPPKSAAAARVWLATVARNLSVRLRLRDSRRRRRELAAAGDSNTEDPVDRIVERIEVQRGAAAAVTRLEEPFRTAILWRYYEGMSNAQIAERLGVPESTVRSRVMRGLARLRAGFERDGGRDWRSALAAACLPTWRAGSTATLGLAMSAKLAWIGAAIVVASATLWMAASPWFGPAPAPGSGAGAVPVAQLVEETPAPRVQHAGPDGVVEPPIERAPVEAPTEAEPDRLEVIEDELRGNVLLPDGRPAVGALVQYGRHQSHADAAGAFAVPIAGVDEDAAIVAVAAAFEPASIARAQAASRGLPLTIRLAGEAATIEGRLVDAHGLPMSGWKLELNTGTEAAWDHFPPMFAEDVAAGATLDVPRHPNAQAPPSPNLQRTGPNGEFTLRGLRRDRDYRIRTWNDVTLDTAISPPVRGGTLGYVFALPVRDARERVFGRVRTRFGTPLEGVRVRLTMRVHQHNGSTSYNTGQRMDTGADGEFEFRDVPRTDLLIRFTGSEVESLYYEFEAQADGRNLDIELTSVCTMRFETTEHAGACDQLRVLDAVGNELRVSRRIAPGRTSGGREVPITGGRTEVLAVPDDAAWVVLYDGDVEAHRLPVRLQPDDTVVVRW